MLCRLQARSDAEASVCCSQGAVFMPAFWECLIQASFLGKDGARMVHPAPWLHCLSPFWIQTAAKRKKTLLQLGGE